jgi:hypothetical protein
MLLARSRPVLLLGLIVCAGLLALALMSSIAFGAADIAHADVWSASRTPASNSRPPSAAAPKR